VLCPRGEEPETAAVRRGIIDLDNLSIRADAVDILTTGHSRLRLWIAGAWPLAL